MCRVPPSSQSLAGRRGAREHPARAREMHGSAAVLLRTQHSSPAELESYHAFLRKFSAEFGGWNRKPTVNNREGTSSAQLGQRILMVGCLRAPDNGFAEKPETFVRVKFSADLPFSY